MKLLDAYTFYLTIENVRPVAFLIKSGRPPSRTQGPSAHIWDSGLLVLHALGGYRRTGCRKLYSVVRSGQQGIVLQPANSIRLATGLQLLMSVVRLSKSSDSAAV